MSHHELYATGTTGRMIEEVTNLTVHKFLAGHTAGPELNAYATMPLEKQIG